VPPLVAVPVADAMGRSFGGDPQAALGWQTTLAAWGALAAVAALAWLVPARHPRAHPQPRPRAGNARPAAGDRPAGPPMYRSRVAWGVLLVFGTTSYLFYSLVAWFPTRLVDAGVGEAQAGVQLAVLTATGMPLALVVPRIAERTGRASPLVAGFAACIAVGLIGLIVAPDRLTTLWSILIGLGAGGFPLGLTLIGLRTRTALTTARLSGFVQGLGYGMAATGALVLGLLHEVTGGWTAPLALLVCALVLLPVGAWIVDRHGTVDDDLDAQRIESPESPARWRRIGRGAADTLSP
jgi:CP family cyanate transporter-like MFS transporter